jgi:hypothetical protein
MSIGPAPALNGFVSIMADTGPAAMQDANGDVTAGCFPSGGDGNGGQPDVCQMDSSGSDGTDDGTASIYGQNGSPPYGPGGDYYGEMAPGQYYYIYSGGAAGQSCESPSSLGCVPGACRIALYPDGCAAAGEIRVGDLLLTRDADGRPAGEAVAELRISTQPCVAIETQSGRRIVCSLSHELPAFAGNDLVCDVRRAADLSISASLALQDGRRDPIASIAAAGDMEVVQISLRGPNNLYLAEGFWSHNKLTTDWPV